MLSCSEETLDTGLLPRPTLKRRVAIWLEVLCLAAIALGPVEGYTANRQEIPLDAVVLMDDSGSMRKTDPLKLRFSALALFIQLLRNDDAVGIVQFDDSATVRAALRLLQSDKDRSVLESVVTQFSSRGAYTNIYAGLQTALREMQQHSREGPEKAVILVSDGLMDVNPTSGLSHAETLRALHDQLLPEYRTARIKIVTLALSEEADRTLLQDIAIATGGQFFYVPRSEALSQALFSIFDGLKSPDLIPADGPQVLIDSSVKEATFFILTDAAKEDVTLIRPDGNRINRKRRDPSVKWHMGKDHVLVTIQGPLAGEWQC
jgi:Mg-chelatase subunit ChlD